MSSLKLPLRVFPTLGGKGQGAIHDADEQFMAVLPLDQAEDIARAVNGYAALIEACKALWEAKEAEKPRKPNALAMSKSLGTHGSIYGQLSPKPKKAR